MKRNNFPILLFCVLFISISCDSKAQNRASFSDKIDGATELKLMNWSNFPTITIGSVISFLGTPDNQDYEEMTGEYALEYSGNYLFFLEKEPQNNSHLYSWVINNDELFIKLKTQTIKIGDNLSILQQSYPNSWNFSDTENKAFYLFSNNGSDDYLLINWDQQGRISKISLIASPI